MQFTQIINMEQRNPQEKLINHQQDQQQPPPPPRRAKSLETQTAANNHQPPPTQRCPRCDSSNTKFCYYNNYSLSQPRYFCKACRRYWTHGGTLRNVPVGGGCRKTRRPKPSSSSANEIAITQSLQSQNLTGMVNPGQGLRATSPVISSMGNSFYATGAFMSPLAGLQSLPVGINQGAAVNFNGGGNGLFGGNMALLQGMNLQSVRNPQQFQAQNDIFRSQPSLNNPQRPLNSWAQSLINRSTTTTSAASTTFWGGGNGENQAGSSSFNPNPWSDKNPGFGPSQ